MKIRSCSGDELLAIAPCIAQSKGPWSLSELQKVLVKPQYALHLIQAENNEPGTAAGFLLYTVVADECNLLYVEVMRQYRKKGYGSALMAELIAQAHSKHCHAIFLEVRRSNQGAIALYESLEIVISATRTAYYPALAGNPDQDREDAVLMILNLV